MKLARKFIVAFVRGAGTTAGAFVAKECLTLIKDEHKRDELMNKAEGFKNRLFKKQEVVEEES